MKVRQEVFRMNFMGVAGSRTASGIMNVRQAACC
jgi:hypothetical protein